MHRNANASKNIRLGGGGGGLAGRHCGEYGKFKLSINAPAATDRSPRTRPSREAALFHAKTAKEEPLNCRRLLEIYLASGDDVTGKEGRPKGSTKAARTAAEGWAAAVPPPAASGLGPGTKGRGRRSGGSPTAAPAGAGAPDDSRSYGTFSSAP